MTESRLPWRQQVSRQEAPDAADGSGIGVPVETRCNNPGDAGVVRGQLRPGLLVDDVPDRPLHKAASSDPCNAELPLAPGHIEAVRCAVILGQFRVGSRTTQTADVLPARLNRRPVVLGPVEQPDRLSSHGLTVDKRDVAARRGRAACRD
jgi:hypothetical protein